MTSRGLLWTALAVFGTTCAFTPAAASGAAGDLDPSFSADGRVSLIAAGSFVARAVAIQPDGRVVVAGFSCERGESDNGVCLNDGNSSFRLARFTPDGGLDPEFGEGGLVTTPVGSGRSQAFDVVITPDGRIIAGGVARASEERDSFALAGYTASGALDERFGDDGVVLTPVGTGFAAIADLVTQADGAIIAVGQARDDEGRARVAVARYARDGRLDGSFGAFGSVLTGTAPYNFGLAGWIAPDGTIVTAGIAGNGDADPASFRIGIARVASAGAAGGGAELPVGTSSSFANALGGLADGRWLAAGAATDAEGRQAMALVRGRPDGTLDPEWTGDGVALVRVGDGALANDLAIDPAGRALAVGQAAVGDGYHFALARFDGGGGLDPAFGSGGLVTTPWSRFAVARATAGALAADGKLVVTGIGCLDGSGARCEKGTPTLLLARYLGDPPPPPPGDPGPPRPAPDTTPPSARVTGVPARMRRRTLARRGVLVRIELREEAAITATLARRTGRRWRTLVRRSLPFAAGRRTVRLRSRRIARGGRRVTLRVELHLRDRAGNSARVHRTLRAE